MVAEDGFLLATKVLMLTVTSSTYTNTHKSVKFEWQSTKDFDIKGGLPSYCISLVDIGLPAAVMST